MELGHLIFINVFLAIVLPAVGLGIADFYRGVFRGVTREFIGFRGRVEGNKAFINGIVWLLESLIVLGFIIFKIHLNNWSFYELVTGLAVGLVLGFKVFVREISKP